MIGEEWAADDLNYKIVYLRINMTERRLLGILTEMGFSKTNSLTLKRG